jgi:serine protease Do
MMNMQLGENRRLPGILFLNLVIFITSLCFGISVSAQTAARGIDSDSLHSLNRSVQSLVGRVAPSVVQLLVTGYGPVESAKGNTSLVLGKQQSIGSGVIIDPDGFIITNYHVVQSGRRIQVNIPSVSKDETPDESLESARGRTYEARVVGWDQKIDLAVLKIDAKGLPALRLADYHKLRQGEVVFAFGSPEGLQNSVSMGVVSATARQPDPDNPMVYVQTDAPINPGNSGGPLVTVDGELIGINTFILTTGGGNEGIGFAIPSATIAFAYPQLRRYGHVHRGETGMTVQAITPTIASGLKIPSEWGIIVSDVEPGSPAETAGVKILDIVTSVDGQPAVTLPSVATRLFMRGGGEQIKVGVLRGAEKLSFNLPVVELPREMDRLADLVNPEKSLVTKLGIIGLEIDAKTAEMVGGLRIPSGVIVAAKAADPNVDTSLTAGDVIHAANGVSITTIDSLRSTLDHLGSGSPVVLQVERDGKLQLVAFHLD